MPDEYTSSLEPEKPASRAPPPRQAPAPAPQPIHEEYSAPPPKTEPKPKPPPKKESPAPPPAAIFDLFDNNNEEPKKTVASENDNILMSPIKPTEQPSGKTEASDTDTIGKLNNIMKQMQIKEVEEQNRKDEEAKKRTEGMMPGPAYGAPSGPPMMNPQMMQYMTNMAAFNQMGYYGGNPYMTYVPGGMQRPMFQPSNASIPYQVFSIIFIKKIAPENGNCSR